METISDDKPQRTVSIWWFLVLFLGLLAAGGYAVIAWGTYDREPTRELPDTPVTTDASAATTSSTVPVTLVDGSPAQGGIVEVLGTAGDRVYLFERPAEFEEEPTLSVVPEVELTRAEDDRTLTMEFGCAVSAGSRPAMLRVTEDPFEVNLTPVVTGPRLGESCAEGATVGTTTVVLDAPVGTRRLVIARPGTQVDVPGPD